MNLLSVDWDYFFPNPFQGGLYNPTTRYDYLFDWSYRESHFNIETLWPMRAASFLHYGYSLPPLYSGPSKLCTPSIDFWSRFHFSRRCRIYLAESHSAAALPRICRGISRVLSFDAHHDCGYSELDLLDALCRGRYNCANWMLAYRNQADLEVYYPPWRRRYQSENVDPLDFNPNRIPFCPIRRRNQVFHGPTDTISRVFICRSGAWVPPWHDAAFESFIRLPGLPIIDVGTYPRKFSMDDVDKLVEQLNQFEPPASGALLDPAGHPNPVSQPSQ